MVLTEPCQCNLSLIDNNFHITASCVIIVLSQCGLIEVPLYMHGIIYGQVLLVSMAKLMLSHTKISMIAYLISNGS